MTKKKFIGFLNEVLSGHGKPPVSKSELDQVLKLYPASENPIENHKTAAEFLGDETFVCGTRLMLRAAAKYAKAAYMYHFDIPTAGVVLHASELP